MLLRVLRHELREHLKNLDLSLIQQRDSDNDVGKTISFEATDDNKETLKQLIISNFKRVQEALRVIEENLKVINE